ncbi:Hypothetical predicted protein [Lecanosticta acicola]|uniref:Uncharacterized protein n=1 Tax=Lecanosticta acicola TaxID=111012 RepID=A0AAI8YVS8_9PEZI|nr:Hypothetical predicted protein [Lecanosticta acicola]
MVSSDLTRDFLSSGYQDMDDHPPAPPSIKQSLYRLFGGKRDPHFITTRRRSSDHDRWNVPAKSWAKKRKLLPSLVTGEKLILSHPSKGMIARRREWDRRTDRGRDVDYSWAGSVKNQWRMVKWAKMNEEWIRERGFEPVLPEDFQPIHWNKPATRMSQSVSPRTLPPEDSDIDPPDENLFDDDFEWPSAVQHGSERSDSFSSALSSLDHLLPEFEGAKKSFSDVTGLDAHPTSRWSLSSTSSQGAHSHRLRGSDASQESYESFMDWYHSEVDRLGEEQANEPGSMSSFSQISNDEYEDAVIEEATIAVRFRGPRIPVPVREKSLLHLMVFETGLASQSRRIDANESSKKSEPTRSNVDQISVHGSFVAHTSQAPESLTDMARSPKQKKKARDGFWRRLTQRIPCF